MSNEKNTILLIQAARQGNLDDVRLLIAVSDPKADGSMALQLAAENGHAQCVQLLIPLSDPKTDGSYALQLAAKNGHAKCVELLIPVSNPKSDDSLALCWAARGEHTQCVELLYSVSEPLVTLKHLQEDYSDHYSTWGHLQQMVEADRLNGVLHKEIDTSTVTKVQRKM